jgi:hypothetical protein
MANWVRRELSDKVDSGLDVREKKLCYGRCFGC